MRSVHQEQFSVDRLHRILCGPSPALGPMAGQSRQPSEDPCGSSMHPFSVEDQSLHRSIPPFSSTGTLSEAHSLTPFVPEPCANPQGGLKGPICRNRDAVQSFFIVAADETTPYTVFRPQLGDAQLRAIVPRQMTIPNVTRIHCNQTPPPRTRLVASLPLRSL